MLKLQSLRVESLNMGDHHLINVKYKKFLDLINFSNNQLLAAPVYKKVENGLELWWYVGIWQLCSDKLDNTAFIATEDNPVYSIFGLDVDNVYGVDGDDRFLNFKKNKPKYSGGRYLHKPIYIPKVTVEYLESISKNPVEGLKGDEAIMEELNNIIGLYLEEVKIGSKQIHKHIGIYKAGSKTNGIQIFHFTRW